LANAEAIKQGVALNEYKQPEPEYEAKSPDKTWTVFYEGKVKAPGHYFLVWVNDETGACKLMLGR
jgi:hypothetical protein